MAETEPLTELAYQAESGDAQAQYRLGVLFLVGERVDQDMQAAGRWFQSSAANGNNAASRIGQLLATAPSKTPEIPSRSTLREMLVPVFALLLISLYSGYQCRRTVIQKAYASSSPIVVSNSNEVIVPDLQASVAPAKELSTISEPALQEGNSKRPPATRHQKRRARR